MLILDLLRLRLGSVSRGAIGVVAWIFGQNLTLAS